MKELNPDKLYRMAIEKWGIELQSLILMEEMGELFQSWSKYVRYGERVNDVIEELSDVEIMLEQIQTIIAMNHDIDTSEIVKKVFFMKERKLERLEEMLKIE